MWFHKLTASVFGIGYCKGGGTIAAFVFCVCWYLVWKGNYPPTLYSVLITGLIIVIGVWVGNVVEPIWGKDSSRVVIDEVAGMAVTLLFFPVTLKYVIAGLILFRFFDIVKPLYIKKTENLPGGWGVMADDILAGVYSNLLLRALMVIFKF